MLLARSDTPSSAALAKRSPVSSSMRWMASLDWPASRLVRLRVVGGHELVLQNAEEVLLALGVVVAHFAVLDW